MSPSIRIPGATMGRQSRRISRMARTSPRWSCAGGPSLNGAETAQKPELLAAEHGDIEEGLGPGQYRKRCRAIPPQLRWLG